MTLLDVAELYISKAFKINLLVHRNFGFEDTPVLNSVSQIFFALVPSP